MASAPFGLAVLFLLFTHDFLLDGLSDACDGGSSKVIRKIRRTKLPWRTRTGLGKFTSLWRETDGIILVYFWAAPYVLAAISPFGLWREIFGKILRNVYLTNADGEKAYIRWEILWILGSLTNTYIIMSEASQPARLRRCALTWAITFTCCVLKFAAEKQRGWLKGDEANYVFAQLVHAGVALSCYAGYFSSK